MNEDPASFVPGVCGSDVPPIRCDRSSIGISVTGLNRSWHQYPGGLAVVLAFIALAGVCDQAHADDEQTDSVERPFMAYTWHGPRAESRPYENVLRCFWVTYGMDPETVKAATDAMPEGHRVLLSWNLHGNHGDICTHPDDNCRDANGDLTKWRGVWWDHGVEVGAQRFDDFFRRYHEIGGRVDTLVLDYEVKPTTWAIGRNEGRYQAIMNDPRFDQIAEQLGFRDLMTMMNWQRQTGEQRTHYQIWNAVMHERSAEYLNQAFYEPLRRYYPDVQMSNYGYEDGKPPHTCLDRGGQDIHRYSTGAQMHVGTHQSRNLYCLASPLDRYVLPGGYRPYGKSPFNGFRLGVNQMRSMALSGDVPVAPWIAHKRLMMSDIWHSDLYQELIYHVGMCGADVFLLFNPKVWGPSTIAAEDAIDLGGQDKLVSDCLYRLDELVGAADRRTCVEELAGWYDEYMLTGMTAGGRSVWRFTPRLHRGQKREETLHSASPPVFRIGGTEVRIPGGSIYTPEDEHSEQGFWIVAPLDSCPVVTTDWTPWITEEDMTAAAGDVQQFDVNRDGALDRDEVNGSPLSTIPGLGLLGDADEDGRLEPLELAVGAARRRYDAVAVRADSDPHTLLGMARNVRERFDGNGDTYLDRSEWQRPGNRFADIGEAEEDGDGLVSHDELWLWLDRLRSPLPDSLAEHDADDDGQVTKVEFASVWTADTMAEFDSHDQNADGILTADEGVTPMEPGEDYNVYMNDHPRVIEFNSELNSDITIDSDELISDLDVRLSVSLFADHFLDLFLIGPDGQRVELYTGKQLPWENGPLFENTLLDDEAAEIRTTLPNPPRDRSIRPEGVGQPDQPSLSAFYGQPAGGTWRLILRTERGSQSALLHGWALLVHADANECSSEPNQTDSTSERHSPTHETSRSH